MCEGFFDCSDCRFYRDFYLGYKICEIKREFELQEDLRRLKRRLEEADA